MTHGANARTNAKERIRPDQAHAFVRAPALACANTGNTLDSTST
jgi:hypothetical protein